MVNKRGSKYTLQNDLEDRNSYLTSENGFLKKKNEDLAKALSDTRLEYQKLVNGTTELHARMFYVNVERLNYEECLKAMSLDMQSFVGQFLTLTEQLSSLLGKVNFTLKRHKDSDDFRTDFENISPPNYNANNGKTAAIMPMISGHTISKPKINLPRVSIRQLTDMINTNNDEENENDENDSDEMEFNDEDELTNEQEELENSLNAFNSPPNRRLETMHEADEEEEEEIVNSSRSSSLLSGIFKDVKVYISPLSTQSVIQFKKKSASQRRKSNDNRNVSNQSTSRVSNLSAQNESSANSRSKIGENNESSMNSSASTSSRKVTKIWNKASSNSSNDDDTVFNREEDPLEGPSSLWNNTSNLTPNSTPNETSTPFSIKQRRMQRDQHYSKTPTRSSHFVTRRPRTRSGMESKSSQSSIESACTVRLQKLSPNTLNRLNSNSQQSPQIPRSESSETSTCDRGDSPTVLERSSRRISLTLSESSRKRVSVSTDDKTLDSLKSRGRRRVKAVTYKEPPLNKKMRR